jgi:hypothetical protein
MGCCFSRRSADDDTDSHNSVKSEPLTMSDIQRRIDRIQVYLRKNPIRYSSVLEIYLKTFSEIEDDLTEQDRNGEDTQKMRQQLNEMKIQAEFSFAIYKRSFDPFLAFLLGAIIF